MHGIANILVKFEATKSAGYQIISSGELGSASAAMRKKDYKRAYFLYRGIIDRGGKTIAEGIASKRIAQFYENGVGVEKNLDFANEMKRLSKVILNDYTENT